MCKLSICELGPLYCFSGKVIRGRGIGKLIGMPTANLETENIKSLPHSGVYISRIVWKGCFYYGVSHIGRRPTVDICKNIFFETHILNFNSDLYGEKIEVQLFKFLRHTNKFQSMSLLRDQVYTDCKKAREYFSLEQIGAELKPPENTSIRICNLLIDLKRRIVLIKNKEIFFTPKEFDILCFMAKRPGTALTKEEIYEAVWHESSNGYYHAVENTICQIRGKLNLYDRNTMYIKTIVGYGYKLIDTQDQKERKN